MAWVVDTSVVLDIHTGDAVFEPASTACLQAHLADGLVICPISFVEIGPGFGGNTGSAYAFLNSIFISSSEPWTSHDSEAAHRIWHQYQLQRRRSQVAKRPVADVLIAAFAMRFQGIITRNGTDFKIMAPGLTVVEP